MKNNNIKYLSILIALFSLVISSCSDSFNNFADTTLSINVDKSSRNVLPESDISVFTDFKLEGTLDEQSQVLGTWDDYDSLTNASINIAPGKWSLTLSAKINSITFTCEKSDVDIIKGENNSVSFTLSVNENTAGKANLRLKIPSGAGVSRVYWIMRVGENITNDTCYLSTISTVQHLTSNAFTLEKEMNAGKYAFQCFFYNSNGGLIGEYSDFVIIEPGLESKLEYDITYFDIKGVINAESTENGIEIEFSIPKGTKHDALVYRGELQSDGSLKNVTLVFKRYFHSEVTEYLTSKGYDCWNISKDKTYGYYVVYDWNDSTKTPVVSVTSKYDGWETPEFVNDVEFEIEKDANGNLDKLILKPVEMNWKGHDNGWGYALDFGFKNVYTSEESWWWVTKDGGNYSFSKDGLYRLFQFEIQVQEPTGPDGKIRAYHPIFLDPDNIDVPLLKKGDVAVPTLTAQTTENGVKVTVTNIPDRTDSVQIRRMKSNSDNVAFDSYIYISNPDNTSFTVDDYFVKPGVEYVYRLESINYQDYKLSRQSFTPNSGLGELFISNSPVASYENNAKILYFTTEPEFSVDSLDTKLADLCDSYKVEASFRYGKIYNSDSYNNIHYNFPTYKMIHVGMSESGEWKFQQEYSSIIYLTNNEKTITYSYGTIPSEPFTGMPTITIE